jgi:hypothetical protein
MTAIPNLIQSGDDQSNLSDVRPTVPPGSAHLLEARQSLLKKSERIDQQIALARERRERAFGEKVSWHFCDGLEQGFYWLMLAAALACLLLGMLGI